MFLPVRSSHAPTNPGQFAAAGALALLSSLAPAAWAAVPNDTLAIGKAADPQNLDPAVTEENNDWTVTYPCYQRLLRYKVEKGRGSTNLEGDLAASWKVSKDGLVWEFKLRPGQKFDDGAPVDAAAVKFSFERLEKIAQGPSEQWPNDMKVTVVDPLTVRFTLAKICPYFLSMLTNNSSNIVNPDVVGKPNAGPEGKTWLATHTAGSGAFRLTSWDKNQSLVMEPNPNYGGRKPALRKVLVKIIGEPSSRRLLLENGDLDVVEALPVDQLEVIRNKPGLTVVENPSLMAHYMFLNNKRAPFDNPAVRQAISYAVDYQGIVANILKGHAKQLHGAIPDGLWGYDAALPQYKTDLKKAKALLDKAHASNLKLTFVYSAKDPNWEPIGLSLQSNLASLGITLKMEKLANATKSERIGKGDYDISIGRWSPDFADPYEFMNTWFTQKRQGLGGNFAFYFNSKVEDLVGQAIATVDQKKRTALYQKAQRIVVQDAPYVFLYQANAQVAMRKAVKGYVYNPMLEQIVNVETMSK